MPTRVDRVCAWTRRSVVVSSIGLALLGAAHYWLGTELRCRSNRRFGD